MIIDSQNIFCDKQAFEASGASTNTIDIVNDSKIGAGEPLATVICINSSASPTGTYTFEIQTDDNPDFSSPTSIISSTIDASLLTKDSKHVIPIPSNSLIERYMRLYVTVGGTDPNTTITSFIQPLSMIQNDHAYKTSITIQ